MTGHDLEDVAAKPVGVAPHTIAAIVAASIAITFTITGTYFSLLNRIDHQTEALQKLTQTVMEMRMEDSDDRWRGKDADRCMGIFYNLNRAKMPDLIMPVPTSVRDGRMETFK